MTKLNRTPENMEQFIKDADAFISGPATDIVPDTPADKDPYLETPLEAPKREAPKEEAPAKVTVMPQGSQGMVSNKWEAGTFLPNDYEIPSPESNYTKFEVGDTRMRILSRPIIGWLDWDMNDKPHRYPMNRKPEKPSRPGDRIHHFWAFVIWNYSKECVQICETSLKGFQEFLKSHADNPKWGKPSFYDIIVSRKGTKKEDTKYSYTAEPHSDIEPYIMEALLEMDVNLNALWTNDDPFSKANS